MEWTITVSSQMLQITKGMAVTQVSSAGWFNGTIARGVRLADATQFIVRSDKPMIAPNDMADITIDGDSEDQEDHVIVAKGTIQGIAVTIDAPDGVCPDTSVEFGYTCLDGSKPQTVSSALGCCADERDRCPSFCRSKSISLATEENLQVQQVRGHKYCHC